jgi:hypothetical protein
MGERRDAYRILVEKPGRNRPLGSPRHRWEDNAKMDLKEIVWAGVDWVGMAQDRDKGQAVLDTVMNIRIS